MKSKDSLLNNKKNYKPSFLLAWARFLTYSELEQTDNIDAYDAAFAQGLVKNQNDWDKLVLEYNEDNLKKALCIDINKAANDITQHNGYLMRIYSADIKTWLYILDDLSINVSDDPTFEEVKDFYNQISKKYKYDIEL